MKRINIYKLINLILSVLYLIILFVHKFRPVINLSVSEFWFPALLVFLSFAMLVKFIIFYSDSSLWLFITLLLVGIGTGLVNYYDLKIFTYWVVVLNIFALSSTIVGLVFKEIYQIKTAIALTFWSIPFYLYFFKILGFWWCLAILVVIIYVCLFIFSLLPERWYSNNKK